MASDFEKRSSQSVHYENGRGHDHGHDLYGRADAMRRLRFLVRDREWPLRFRVAFHDRSNPWKYRA